jgi:hypothetical protein
VARYAPRPLPASLPLVRIARHAGGARPLGAWVAGLPGVAVGVVRDCAGGGLVVVGADLGALLRRCSAVLVELGGEAVPVDAARLARCRRLTVAADPAPGALARLRGTAPRAHRRAGRVVFALGDRSPEEVLAACRAAGLAVAGSAVEYGPLRAPAPVGPPPAGPPLVDAPAREPLG